MPRKPPSGPLPPYDSAALERAALRYLERFASSAANLRRVLERKIRRRLPPEDDMPAEAGAMVAAIVAKAIAQGWIDDAIYAEQKARGLHRRGASLRVIRQTLAHKGIGAETRETALVRLEEETGPKLDLAAAITLARRRKLGPFRREGERAAHRERDMAVLGRAGFPYDLVRGVILAEDADTLAQMILDAD